MSERGFVIVDCPHCFESSGHPARIVSATYWEPSYAEPDYGRRCDECDGTGMVPCDEAGPDDETDFDDEGYLASLDAELGRRDAQKGEAA